MRNSDRRTPAVANLPWTVARNAAARYARSASTRTKTDRNGRHGLGAIPHVFALGADYNLASHLLIVPHHKLVKKGLRRLVTTCAPLSGARSHTRKPAKAAPQSPKRQRHRTGRSGISTRVVVESTASTMHSLPSSVYVASARTGRPSAIDSALWALRYVRLNDLLAISLDIAVALALYRRALVQGIGTVLPC